MRADKMKNKTTVNIQKIGIAEVSDYTPTKEEELKIIQFEEQAEYDIEQKQTSNVLCIQIIIKNNTTCFYHF